MIIFDLDGTLANCEHRRHFVDSSIPHPRREDAEEFMRNGGKWQPNWSAFYEACDNDEPIKPVISIWNDQISQGMMGLHQIWSGRCESVREKTEKWLDKHLSCFESHQLKMRPIGDNTPDDVLKERWLDEYLASMWPKLAAANDDEGKVFHRDNPIDFVFDDRPKVVRMWRRRGIFVFNCQQIDNEF